MKNTKKTIKDFELLGKKVLMRVDFNVPIKNGEITDDNRIVQALPTIKYALDNGARLILLSHLGRIKTEEDKINKSLLNVSRRLKELLSREVVFVDETKGAKLEEKINSLSNGEVLMIENTRFEDLNDKAESKNSEELGKYWASLGDIFINDAFGTAHRAHASNVGIASNISESGVGFLLEKEVKYLGEAVDNPQRPFVAILGGAKVSDKIDVIERLLEVADKIIIGGGMAYTFLKAKGENIGSSLLESEKLEYAKEMLDRGKDKILLPIDSVYGSEFSENATARIGDSSSVKSHELGLDIGPKTIDLFEEELKSAKTVVWNGPMGVSEWKQFSKGTISICEALANSAALTIVGGGDSAAAAIKFGYADKVSHISTGGGASLQYLEGKSLPGLDAIKNK
ncbi:phosphoglycerate kinase [Mycoplasmatota bacterium]|nr:phosphoglycerate kinase [Mycoplasmatota bacterium]